MTFAAGSSTLDTGANGGDMTFTSGDSAMGTTGSITMTTPDSGTAGVADTFASANHWSWSDHGWRNHHSHWQLSRWPGAWNHSRCRFSVSGTGANVAITAGSSTWDEASVDTSGGDLIFTSGDADVGETGDITFTTPDSHGG